MSMARIRLAAAVMTCLGAAIAIGACGGSGGGDSSGGKQSKDKVEAQQFLNQLDTAVRQGNIEFRVARLNPAVIERYGEQQCRDFLSGQPADTTRRDRVKRVGKPEAFEYDTDNLSVTIPDAISVAVRETRMGKKADRNLHLARVNGELTYFVDCGQPLVRQ
jgi:hypothetical protein